MDSSTRVAEVIKKIKRAEVIIITTSTFFLEILGLLREPFYFFFFSFLVYGRTIYPFHHLPI